MEEKEKVEIEKKKIRLMESKNRLQELERLMCRIYEDMILEKIPSNRYEILNSQYETEQIALSKEIKDLEFAISRYEKETDKAKKFISLISRYENFDECHPLFGYRGTRRLLACLDEFHAEAHVVTFVTLFVFPVNV